MSIILSEASKATASKLVVTQPTTTYEITKMNGTVEEMNACRGCSIHMGRERIPVIA